MTQNLCHGGSSGRVRNTASPRLGRSEILDSAPRSQD